jgi:hypothetical protein
VAREERESKDGGDDDNQLQILVAALQTKHRRDIEATREGEGEETTHTNEQVEASKELTSLKLDQVDQGKGGDTGDKGKEDSQVQGHGFDTNEEPAVLIGNRRGYSKEESQAQVQGHRIETNEKPAERSGGRRRTRMTAYRLRPRAT